MQCVLVLNAMRFGAKRSVFWCKTQCDLVLNAVRFATKCKAIRINIRRNGINITKTTKNRAKQGNIGIKKRFFGGRKWVIGREK